MPLTIAFLVTIAIKVALLTTAAAIVGACLRRQSASMQHGLRIAALALSLIVPLAALVLPQWATIDVPWMAAPPASSTHVAAAEGAPMLAPVVLWLGGVCVLLLREMVRQVSLARWTSRAWGLRSPDWRATLATLALDLPRVRKLRPLESASVSSPCTWGFARPVLLLPAAGNEWTESERRLALTHELAHIHRLDCLTGFIARLACAVHWYNPLVWLSAAEACRLQEQACDDQVLLSGARASDYATLLVTLGGAPNAVAGTDGIGGSPLTARVRALLRAHAPRENDPRRLGAVIAAMSVAALLLASLAPTARAQRTTQVAQPALREMDAPVATARMPAAAGRPIASHLDENTSVIAGVQTIATLRTPAREIAPVPAVPPVPATPPTPVVPVAAHPP